MEPIIPIPTTQALYPLVFPPGLSASQQDREDYLNSLDSDTRDYVMKHTDQSSSKEDLMDCVRTLR